jgi:hypothetical protein
VSLSEDGSRGERERQGTKNWLSHMEGNGSSR